MTTKGNATQILRSASPPLQIRFKSVSSPFLRMGGMGFTWDLEASKRESGMIFCLYSFLRIQISNATKPMVMPMNEQIAMLSRMKPMIRTMAATAPKNTLIQ